MQSARRCLRSGYRLAIILTTIVLLACDSGGDGGPLDQNENEHTAIRFQFEFESGLAAADPDICADYLIQDILVEVKRAPDDSMVTSVERNCGAHGVTIDKIPAGVELNVYCNAFVGQQICWQGQANGIIVDAGQTVDVGPISMTYVCSDQSPPEVVESLPGNITDADINAAITVRFNEPLAPSTVSDDAIVVTHNGDPIPGEISYESSTHTIKFSPQQDYAKYEQYQYNLIATSEHHVTDTAGLPLIGTFNWQFTTGINTSPAANINAPADGVKYHVSTTILFSGIGEDAEDGELDAGSLVWHSNLDNQIGTGSSFSNTLSEGTHTITLTATDSYGSTGSDSITITVASGDINPPSAPQNLRMDQLPAGIIIAWDASTDDTGVTGYKIYRDNVHINTTTEMHYSDSPLTFGQRYCYTVTAVDAAGNESSASNEACWLLDNL